MVWARTCRFTLRGTAALRRKRRKQINSGACVTDVRLAVPGAALLISAHRIEERVATWSTEAK